MKIGERSDNGDSREDIILMENGVHMLTISEEMYKPYGVTYEEMKTDSGLATFLMFLSISIARNTNG